MTYSERMLAAAQRLFAQKYDAQGVLGDENGIYHQAVDGHHVAKEFIRLLKEMPDFTQTNVVQRSEEVAITCDGPKQARQAVGFLAYLTNFQSAYGYIPPSVTGGAFKLKAADELALACAKAVEANQVGSRSAIGDALLNYLEVGHPGGPNSVPEWVKDYEAGL